MYCSLTLRKLNHMISYRKVTHNPNTNTKKKKPSTYNVSQHVNEHIPYAKFALKMRKLNNNNKVTC